MEYRIWLDDIRPMPSFFNLSFTNAIDCINFLNSNYNSVTHISFDHDLGDESELTGYDVACQLEVIKADNPKLNIKYRVHSANPVGAHRIHLAMKLFKKFEVM